MRKKLTIDSKSAEYFTSNGTVTFQESDENVFIIINTKDKGEEKSLSAFVSKEDLLAVFKALAPSDCSY